MCGETGGWQEGQRISPGVSLEDVRIGSAIIYVNQKLVVLNKTPATLCVAEKGEGRLSIKTLANYDSSSGYFGNEIRWTNLSNLDKEVLSYIEKTVQEAGL